MVHFWDVAMMTNDIVGYPCKQPPPISDHRLDILSGRLGLVWFRLQDVQLHEAKLEFAEG